MALDVFTPFGSNTTAVSVSGTTASGALNIPTATTSAGDSTRVSNVGGITVRVHNSTSVIVFIQFGISSGSATTSHMPIAPGGVEIFSIGSSITHIHGITAGSTGTLYATTGVGG